MPELFAKCCMCAKEIHKGDTYYRCTVSACNSGRMKLVFCTVACWEKHLPIARHRKADYDEATA